MAVPGRPEQVYQCRTCAESVGPRVHQVVFLPPSYQKMLYSMDPAQVGGGFDTAKPNMFLALASEF
jgi:hypothetical protein